jgi:hypothetical protein
MGRARADVLSPDFLVEESQPVRGPGAVTVSALGPAVGGYDANGSKIETTALGANYDNVARPAQYQRLRIGRQQRAFQDVGPHDGPTGRLIRWL